MSQAPNIDGGLIQWGDRLFYPGNRVVKVKPPPKLAGGAARQRAAAIRERIDVGQTVQQETGHASAEHVYKREILADVHQVVGTVHEHKKVRGQLAHDREPEYRIVACEHRGST